MSEFHFCIQYDECIDGEYTDYVFTTHFNGPNVESVIKKFRDIYEDSDWQVYRILSVEIITDRMYEGTFSPRRLDRDVTRDWENRIRARVIEVLQEKEINK